MHTVEELIKVLGSDPAYTVLAYILAVCMIVAIIGKAVDVVRSLMRPARAKSDDVQTCLHNDKRRLDAHEGRIQALEDGLHDTQDGQRVLMQGVMALLEHELHNGNSEQMEQASRDIQSHLLRR